MPELNFMYLHAAHIGYGYQGIATHRALERIGVDVYDGLPGSGDLDIMSKKRGICNNVVFLSTPTHATGWWTEQRAHIFTMFEGSDLPETMRESLHNFETVIVPSEHCMELYGKYHDNVKYAPLGVDGQRWEFRERREGMFFNFLVAGSGTRKGADLARKAFTKVFGRFGGDGPIPRLIIKDPRGAEPSGDRIEVVSGYLDPEAEVELYADAHCYIGASRGEGWGMQPLQAIAQGCPTILTDAHGHKAFSKYGLPIGWEWSKSDYFLFGDAGQWWEPHFDELCARMEWVYDHYAFEKQQAVENSRIVRDTFTWEASAQAIVDAVGGVTELTKPRHHGGLWFTPDAKKFKVVTHRDWRADIAGVTYLFRKGQAHYVPADVKRILFEGGVLDPVCLDGGDGLTDPQVARLSEYQGVG